jgi:hypothetical protein
MERWAKWEVREHSDFIFAAAHPYVLDIKI